jgi:hypothetical protein
MISRDAHQPTITLLTFRKIIWLLRLHKKRPGPTRDRGALNSYFLVGVAVVTVAVVVGRLGRLVDDRGLGAQHHACH